ncbi:heavy-metal-associated domain-containing protein [Streptomyces sp. JH34]|uniref:heavy-metal-associated domain-containing protein n=1 Tax=Streptomyces sp. JH34 TaxID=2793633 RepID=UPI0023F98D38|nr:heavy-metal-associated domain-containing protein [Streptomyces sp. JH34]MDF6021061.1 heavy-metal-associated domain-containing protein [Streptomyces sp. JH34]
MTTETDTPKTAGSCCSSTGSCDDRTAGTQAGGVTAVYEVKGMTCGHCEGAVSEELSAIEGVTSVKAEAATGRVTVASAAALTDESVRAAVDEAGYELVGRA